MMELRNMASRSTAGSSVTFFNALPLSSYSPDYFPPRDEEGGVGGSAGVGT